jgi:hypothetical protein
MALVAVLRPDDLPATTSLTTCGSTAAALELVQHSAAAADSVLLPAVASPSGSAAAAAAALDQLAPRHCLTALHDSVLLKLLAQLDTRSKCALMCTCTLLARHLGRQEYWRELAFDTANEQHGLAPSVLFSLLKRSQGGCEVVQLARCVDVWAVW